MHNIEFKDPSLIKEYEQIDSRLRVILEDMALFCSRAGHKFVITDLLSEESEDKKLNRVSTSHRDGRAADIRVRDWPLEFRRLFELNFEKLYSHWAATSKATGKKNLIFIHDNGNALHCHIQVSKGK